MFRHPVLRGVILLLTFNFLKQPYPPKVNYLLLLLQHITETAGMPWISYICACDW
jgi:hypothetical protein